MVAYLYKMPSGIPGAISRLEESTVEGLMLDTVTPPTAFGLPIKVVSNKGQAMGAGSTPDQLFGLLVRTYPTSGNGVDGLGTSTPNTQFPADILKRGYMTVLLNNFAAVPSAKDGKVYLRVGNASTGKVIGQFEAANDIGVVAAGPTGTGNGTVSLQTATDATPVGVYTLKALTATNFNVVDANGAIVGNTNTGVTYTADNGLTFRITVGGTPFVAGDTFTLTVTDNTILIPNAKFTGAPDIYGNAEIAYNI